LAKAVDNGIRSLPSITALLRLPDAVEMKKQHGHEVVVNALRGAVEAYRESIRGGEKRSDCASEEIVESAARSIAAQNAPRLKRVINATGIILHTGLGRAVIPKSALDAIDSIWRCCNVQLDLETGQRVGREAAVRDLLHELTGAEDALLVNNNAGATMLVLRALAHGKDAVVSRGELIEIGGSFRLPEIMAESGAVMREVGSTNKTHPRDYVNAIVEGQTGLLFKAHKSNYEIVGFAQEVGIEEISAIAHKNGIPAVDDIGCGALVPLETYGLDHEMTMGESLEAGADVVLSSTDKLIGGPQGGLILGSRDLLGQIRSHPLYRALRVDKLTLAVLEATLRLFLAPELLPRTHPLYAMLAKTEEEMSAQATLLRGKILKKRPGWSVSIEKEAARLGGGSLPGSGLPSIAVAVKPDALSAEDLARRLRTAATPVIPHIRDGAVFLNMRTVFADETAQVAAALLDSP